MNEETDRARREARTDTTLEYLQKEVDRLRDALELAKETASNRIRRLEGGIVGVLVGGTYLFLKSQGLVP